MKVYGCLLVLFAATGDDQSEATSSAQTDSLAATFITGRPWSLSRPAHIEAKKDCCALTYFLNLP